MRPSKFRFPESTAAATSCPSLTALATGSGSGPLVPMQGGQPKPTRGNPRASSAGSSPASFKYSVTTFEPGARLVFTYGGTFRPRSAAFFASRPAPSITEGFEVLVQEVMAAMTNGP